MKTAYELAMERLAKDAPPVRLSAAQKRELAELDSQHKARVAERELAAEAEIQQATAAGDLERAEKARQELLAERRKLEASLEDKKDAVRNAR